MRSLLLLIFFTTAWSAGAQNIKDIFIDESANGRILTSYLQEVEKQYQVDFIGDQKKLEPLSIAGVVGRQRLLEYMQTQYAFILTIVKVNDKVVFLMDRYYTMENELEKSDYLLFPSTTNASVSITGNLIDGQTNDPLVGAQVYIPAQKKGILSDANGKFSLLVNTENITLIEIKYVGYEPRRFVIGRSKHGNGNQISTTLYPVSKELQSVTITAERINENVLSQITGIEKLSIETIKSLPTFLGEVDPIRSLTTLPGVATSGELASGFNVRGGESGQNLVLQDGATIYNPSHLFGFFSAFNPDMVNGVTLYKGSGPANFGTRISSILDVSLRKGNPDRHAVTGGIGLVSSRLLIEGPIGNGNASYIVGGRISYCNWLVRAIDNVDLKNSAANFHDITARIFQPVNDRNYLTLSVYNSYDGFALATDSVFSWGTFNVSMKWDHTFSERLSAIANITTSNYFSEVKSNNDIDAFVYRNAIRNNGLKYELIYSFGEESKVSGGMESTATLIEPGRLEPANNAQNVVKLNMNDQHVLESAAFVQGDFKASKNWSFGIGLRYSHFLRLGKEDIYHFDYSQMNGRYPAIDDTVRYARMKTIKQYTGFEPRVSIRYLLREHASLKASFYRGYQYMHLISNTTSTTPQDYWIASGPYLRPQIGDQFSLGYFQNFKDNVFEFSIEGFYKNIQQAVDYIEGADITLNPRLEAGLVQGKGIAYGMELFLKKASGKFTGWLSYTHSRSLRKFADQTSENFTLNNGKYYASTFDQPHILSIVMSYKVGKRGILSTNFNYSTGRPITIPVSKFSYDVYLSVLNYSERNAYRIPDYHRLDLSFTIRDKPGRTRRYKDEWVFSIFNVYSRNNAYAITFDRFGKAKKLSVLGSMFPSVTYNFSF